MPYVKPGARVRLDRDNTPMNVGELNYCITEHLLHTDDTMLPTAVRLECDRYLEFRRKPSATADYSENNYEDFNGVLGALDAAAREYKRRRGVQTMRELNRLDVLRAVGSDLYDEVVAPYEDTKIVENGDIYR